MQTIIRPHKEVVKPNQFLCKQELRSEGIYFPIMAIWIVTIEQNKYVISQLEGDML